MKERKNIPFYLISIALVIFLKFGYSVADNDNLIFLLYPTDKIVGLLSSSSSVYFSDKGFYHVDLNILIEKSCSGYDFMLLCFCILTYLSLRHLEKPYWKSLSILISLIVAYILTILVNASRIIASIIIQHQANYFLPDRPHLVLHEIVGIITNLTFLILIYAVFRKFLTNKYKNEKPA